MGYMLFNERMLETYLHARKWLRPGGKIALFVAWVSVTNKRKRGLKREGRVLKRYEISFLNCCSGNNYRLSAEQIQNSVSG